MRRFGAAGFMAQRCRGGWVQCRQTPVPPSRREDASPDENALIVPVPEVLTAEELGKLRAALAHARFVDGASTAGWSARVVKKNL